MDINKIGEWLNIKGLVGIALLGIGLNALKNDFLYDKPFWVSLVGISIILLGFDLAIGGKFRSVSKELQNLQNEIKSLKEKNK